MRRLVLMVAVTLFVPVALPAFAIDCGAEATERFVRSSPTATEAFTGSLASVRIAPGEVAWSAADGVELISIGLESFPADTGDEAVEIGAALQLVAVTGRSGLIPADDVRQVSVSGVPTCPEPEPRPSPPAPDVSGPSASVATPAAAPSTGQHPLRELLLTVLLQPARSLAVRPLPV